MYDELDFDNLIPVEIPLSICAKKYLLREATGATATEFRNMAIACSEYGSDGKLAKIRGVASVEPFLVSRCLFSEDGKPVDRKVIEAWPARVQKRLFQKIKDISDLNETDTVESLEKQIGELQKKLDELRGDKPKNETGDTTVGSV